jgi:4-alpha-glucanotransferase
MRRNGNHDMTDLAQTDDHAGAVHRVIDRRRAGVLLHPTSLPSGGLGHDALRLVDFLAGCGISIWQMLPLGPTHEDGSPYLCTSVHAINPALIDFADLVKQGWLDAAVADEPGALALACERFHAGATAAEHAAFDAFCSTSAHWLDDYALYQVLRDKYRGSAWWEWPAPLRDREPGAMERTRAEFADLLRRIRFGQFIAARQWQSLREYAHARGVRLFGDMPIFVAHDSAEVWAHREYFRLDETGHPEVVAGVPPDYFSSTGQRWGNPLYDWERMQADGFEWWIERLQTEFSRFDLVRVDHFRGFEACWEIPATDETAVNGRWLPVPGEALFDALLRHFGALPLVVEDLGLITPEVHRLRRRYGFPGMLVLQFAFGGGPTNPYLPHNHLPDAVVYTGTHDNDTTRGWFENLPAADQLYVVDYFGYQQEPMPWPLIRAALASVADLAVIPMQDLLGLGGGHRMNTPGTAKDNWRWRFSWDMLVPDATAMLQRLTRMYGRA